jgi:hypothetical protein
MADSVLVPSQNWLTNVAPPLLIDPEWPAPRLRLVKGEWVCQSEADNHVCVGRAYTPECAYRQWAAIMNWSKGAEPWKGTLWQRFLHWWGG